MKWWTNGGLTFSLGKSTFGYGLNTLFYTIERESLYDIRQNEGWPERRCEGKNEVFGERRRLEFCQRRPQA